jgi:putative RNA 2'-phosphotransferase
MSHPALIERITRSLAYMLRHQPEKFDLQLDSQGFGELDDVARALQERLDEPITVADIEHAVASGDRPRYEIRGTKIGALYGHSFGVDPGEPAQPPEFLFVGIDARNLQQAQNEGLSGGRRSFLHLALTPEDAREAGRRAAREYAVLRVFGLDAWEDGINFYDRKTLFLAGFIPTEHLEVLERASDGYEPRHHEDGGDGGGRGNHGDRRGARTHFRGGAPRDFGRSERPREDEHRRAPAREEPPASQSSQPDWRSDGGGRGDRSREGAERRDVPLPRHDRGGRPARPERREDDRNTPPRPPAPAPATRATSPASEGDFGLGIFEEPAKPKASSSSPAPRRAPEPPPREPARSRPDDASDFGAGL